MSSAIAISRARTMRARRMRAIRPIFTVYLPLLLLDEALSGIQEELERKIVAKLVADTSISILVHVGHRRSVQALFEYRIIDERCSP